MSKYNKESILESANYKYRDDPLVSQSQWKDILQNCEITHDINIKTILVVLNSPKNRTTATHIAEVLGEESYHIISAGNTSFSRRICKFLNITPPKNSNGGNRWWTIPYWGSISGDGKYFYILRPELKKAIKELLAEGKIFDSSQEIVKVANEIIEVIDFQQEFDYAIEQSRNLTKEARMYRIINADKNPVQIRVVQTIFRRNPDVVTEALERATGICEACKEPAPFIRKSDNRPYLEVHHIKALSDGGQDTLENTIAICPNCHRSFHYGIG